MTKIVDKKYINKLGIKIKNGSRDCVSDLYTEMRYILHHFVKKHIFNKQETEDVVQEIFVVFIENIQRYHCENVYALLHGIAKNIVLEHNRERHHADIDDYKKIHEDAEILSVYFYVTCALSKLHGVDRAIMVFKFVKDYTFKQISDEMGMPETTIKRKVKKFQEKMQKELDDEGL